MGETIEWSSLPKEKRPKFYTIVHTGILQNGSFELPAKIVRKIGKDIVDDGVAILKVPNGNECRVKMIREFDVDDCARVWFRNGIREFIDHYSIALGHFLVFRYDGNSRFHVLIFDMTATEIGYHLYGNEDDPSEHSNDIDDLDNIKSVGTKDSEDDVDYVEISSGSPTDTNDESGEEGNENEVAEKPPSSSRKNRRKSYSDKEYVAHANAIESRFTSKYPFFRVILQTSYMKSRYMPIPCAIKRLYFPDDVKDVKIKASDGRLWKIAVLHSGKDNMRFCKGVTDLINKKNGLNLKVGDVLIFEIVKKGCLKVNVFRYKRDA